MALERQNIEINNIQKKSAPNTAKGSPVVNNTASVPLQNGSAPSSINNQPLRLTQSAVIDMLRPSQREPAAPLKAMIAPALQGSAKLLQRRSQESTVRSDLKPAHHSGGLPAPLKAGLENLSGISMNHVRVHYNSPRPAQLQAHAYTQGGDIHIAPGQEKHLPHEGWHVVQQAQGRVRPTFQLRGQMASPVHVNDDAGLEREADAMGERAAAAGERALQRREGGDGDKRETAGDVKWVDLSPISSQPNPGKNQPIKQGVLQRRLITEEQEEALLNHDNDINDNLEGFKQIVKRTLWTLVGENYNSLNEKTLSEFNKTAFQLAEGDVTDVRKLTRCMRELFPAIVYPGVDRTFGKPQNPTEGARFHIIVNWAVETLKGIGRGDSDNDIRSVFGEESPYGLNEVRDRFRTAASTLEAHANERIFTDMTGARDEMQAGAVANFDRHILMKKTFLAGNDNGSESGISLMHEAMHFAFSDIKDNGGYSHPEDSFRTRPASVKFANAPHYEEVIRRATGANPVGGDFIPEDTPGGELTPEQQAIGKASRTLQIAWERSLNVHGFLVNHIFSPSLTNNRALSYFSELFELTLHKRADRLGENETLTVNNIDLVGVESATRILSNIKQEFRKDLLSNVINNDVEEMTSILIRKAVQGGPITGSEDRDIWVIEQLVNSPENPQSVN